MPDALRRATLFAPILLLGGLLLGCGGDRSHGPLCGLAQIAGPTIIQQRLDDPRALLTDVPRGLPGSLPARVAGRNDTARVTVQGYSQGQLVLSYTGRDFPTNVSDTTVYGLLVVDDTSQRVLGVLVYESPVPRPELPRIGMVAGNDRTVPLLGVRVSWADVSNPTCPLLGSPVPASGARS